MGNDGASGWIDLQTEFCFHRYAFHKSQEVLMDTFTGSYGIVALPDQVTSRRVKWLGEQPINGGTRDVGEENRYAEFKTKVAHLTLYHGKVVNLPLTDVYMILRALRPLRGCPLLFDRLAVYGDKFLFLDVLVTPELMLAHLAALQLATFLNKEALAHAKQEGLNMSEPERVSLERFGHPLAYSLFRPHFTLAYDSSANINVGDEVVSKLPAMGLVESFAFVEIGEYGAIKRALIEG
jgi:hypothetical protein